MALTGPQKLAVFLCKFSDNARVEPQPAEFYKDLFVKRGTGGLNDYWVAASLGNISLDGTEVFGWRALKQKQADFLKAHPGRWDKVKGGADAFPEVDTSKYAGIVTVFNTEVGDAGTEVGVLASPDSSSVTFLAHETGHVFGLEHSFDESDRKLISWSAPGEYYDRYDVMSAMNVDSEVHERFGERGPLLCAANLDRMGWLPASRVWELAGKNSSGSGEFDLVSLSHPEIPGFLAARVGGVYVEFRTPDLWDAGLSRPGVLIHQMRDPNAVILASNLATYTDDWQPRQKYGASDVQMAVSGGFQIRVKGFNLAAKKARIEVRVAARRPIVSGPGVILGGVASDGGGVLILNGRVIPIPPRSPVFALAEQMAALITAESGLAALSEGLGLGRGAPPVVRRG